METEWGKGGGVSSATDGGGKVQCVRRFGLAPEENAEGVMRRKVRHVTAVEMSQHNAEDVSEEFVLEIGLLRVADFECSTFACYSIAHRV